MSKQLLASKIITRETKPRVRNIPASATAVLAVQGIAERGPVNTPTLCQSWEDYVRVFGWFIANGDLATVVYSIYLNDPRARIWVNRIVHYTTISLPATKQSAPATVNIPGETAEAQPAKVTSANAGPWNLEPAQVLNFKVDAGATDPATFDAARATVTGAGFSITSLDGDTLIIAIDGGEQQTLTFTASEVSLATVITFINANMIGGYADDNGGQLRITGDIRGTDGEVDIIGGTALTELGLSIATTNGTGDVGNINAVTFAEAQTIIEADVSGVACTEETDGKLTVATVATGSGHSIQVEASSTAVAFGFDNNVHDGSDVGSVTTLVVEGKYDGTYAHDLRFVVEAPTNGVADYFNAKVTDSDGVLIEVFPNVQNTDDTATDFIETVFNDDDDGSLYLKVTDQGEAVTPDYGTYTPASGNDGLTGLVDTDWIGDATGATGLRAFDVVQDITLVLDGGRATAAWQNAIVTYCEVTRDGTMFFLLDPPEGSSYTEIVTWVKTTAALKELTEYGSIFWPRPKIVNPDAEIFGADANIVVPATGIVGGLISRTDNAQPGGVYTPPAGVENGILLGVVGFEDDDVLKEEVRDYVYPERINPLTTLPGFPRFNDGVWTLKSGGNFPSIAERRGVIYIEGRIATGIQFARHRNNDAALRGEVTRTVEAFLIDQMRLGAFRTKDPATAFFVDFSEALNTPAVIFANKLKGRIGLATQKPTEWIIIEYSQDTRAIEEELAG